MADIRSFMVVALVALAFTTGVSGAADLASEGRAAYERGDFAEAERFFTQALRERPRDPALHYQRAVALTRLARGSEAAAAYRTCLALDPSPEIAAAAREGLRRLAVVARARPAPPAAQETEIPLRRALGGWFAEVTLHDGRTATFLVDTGASVCVISPQLASAAGIDVSHDAERITLMTLGGRTSGRVVTIPSLRVGDAEAVRVPAVVHELSGMDGILGNTFLARFVATLDPARGVLSLRPR